MSTELQLQIQTIQFTPASVTFNALQIASVLDQQLFKYQGLTFTEDTEADAKKAIAELRKGKALLETYRKTTKAELTVAVTEFEQQIKELADKFDAVINPLTEQTAQFERDRVEKKQSEIEKCIASLIVKYGLNAESAAWLIIPDHYLNRTTTMKTINSELLNKAAGLKAEQDRTEAERTLIRESVELANNSLAGAGLLEYTYTRLLGHMTLAEVLTRLNADVTEMKTREEKAAVRAAEVAQAKAEAEEKRLVLEEAARNAFSVAPVIKPMPMPVPVPVPNTTIEDRHGAHRSDVLVKNYRVTGTVLELEQLEAFLANRLYAWEV